MGAEITTGDELKFERRSYREIGDGVNAAVGWLSSLGISVPATRIGNYAREMERLEERFRAGTLERTLQEEGTRAAIDTLVEASEIEFVYRMLEPFRSAELERRLRDYAKGPIASRDERPATSSNRARNVGLELSVGAQLVAAGLDVQFHPDGDLQFPFEGHDFFIECKRPQAAHQTNRAVKDALQQLDRRYAAAPTDRYPRGLVALSLTKLANPEGLPVQLRSSTDIEGFHSGLAFSVIAEHGRLWQRAPNARTLGALLEFTGFFVSVGDARASTGRYLTMNDRPSLPREDRELLERFASRMLHRNGTGAA